MKEEEVQTEELTLFPWRVTTAQVSHIYFVSADRIEKYKLTPTITITFFFFLQAYILKGSSLWFQHKTRKDRTEKFNRGQENVWNCFSVSSHVTFSHNTNMLVVSELDPLLSRWWLMPPHCWWGVGGHAASRQKSPYSENWTHFVFVLFFFSSKDQNISQVHSKDDRFSGVLRRQHASLDLRQHDVVSERFSKI